jgi:catechol 2,3-dioxygenase-like lactoylglutathione lyase family enzyme
MASQLEHANISVPDIDQAVKFLTTALPDFEVRGGNSPGEDKWVHIGTESTYITLNEDSQVSPGKGPGLNHLGFIVEDAESIRTRLESAGYKEGFVVGKQHPHRQRIYYLDGNGMEWEFVQYFSDDPSERNDYSM